MRSLVASTWIFWDVHSGESCGLCNKMVYSETTMLWECDRFGGAREAKKHWDTRNVTEEAILEVEALALAVAACATWIREKIPTWSSPELQIYNILSKMKMVF